MIQQDDTEGLIAVLVVDEALYFVLLQKRIQESKRDNRERIADVRRLQAFHLFTQHRFEDCLKIYSDLNTGMSRA